MKEASDRLKSCRQVLVSERPSCSKIKAKSKSGIAALLCQTRIEANKAKLQIHPEITRGVFKDEKPFQVNLLLRRWEKAD